MKTAFCTSQKLLSCESSRISYFLVWGLRRSIRGQTTLIVNARLSALTRLGRSGWPCGRREICLSYRLYWINSESDATTSILIHTRWVNHTRGLTGKTQGHLGYHSSTEWPKASKLHFITLGQSLKLDCRRIASAWSGQELKSKPVFVVRKSRLVIVADTRKSEILSEKSLNLHFLTRRQRKKNSNQSLNF